MQLEYIYGELKYIYGEPDVTQEELEGSTSGQRAMIEAISAFLFGTLPSHRDTTCERETTTFTKHVLLTKPDRLTQKNVFINP